MILDCRQCAAIQAVDGNGSIRIFFVPLLAERYAPLPYIPPLPEPAKRCVLLFARQDIPPPKGPFVGAQVWAVVVSIPGININVAIIKAANFKTFFMLLFC